MEGESGEIGLRRFQKTGSERYRRKWHAVAEHSTHAVHYM